MFRSASVHGAGLTLTVAVLLMLSACSTPSPPAPTPTPLPTPTPTATPPPKAVWTVESVPWTEPRRVGAVIVLGLLQRDLPYLTGLDAATGEKLWSHPMSPSSVVRGMEMSFRVRDGIVEFLEGKEKPSSLAATLTSVRATTGEVIARTEAREFDSYPGGCDHDSKQTCVSSDGIEFQLSKDRRSLSKLPKPAAPDLDWMEDIGPYGLVRYSLGPGHILGLASVAGTKVRWKVSEKELFGGDFSTNGGWSFDKLDKPKYIVGSVGTYSGGEMPDSWTEDRATSVTTVAIDARNGELVWRRDGVGTWCLDGLDDELDVMIACGATGTVSYRDRTFHRWANPGRVLEGIDPRTGDVQWWVKWQPHARSAADVHAEPARLTDTTVLARGPDPLVIDVTTGDSRPAEPGDVGWCETSDPQTEYPVGAPDGDTIWGTTAYQPCDGSNDSVEAMPSKIPEAVGLRVDDLAVALHKDRVVAYRVDR